MFAHVCRLSPVCMSVHVFLQKCSLWISQKQQQGKWGVKVSGLLRINKSSLINHPSAMCVCVQRCVQQHIKWTLQKRMFCTCAVSTNAHVQGIPPNAHTRQRQCRPSPCHLRAANTTFVCVFLAVWQTESRMRSWKQFYFSSRFAFIKQ